MGFGDVILMAMIGSFLGWQPTVVVFFIAPECALLVVAALWVIRRDREIPYGPYLSIATLILILGWTPGPTPARLGRRQPDRRHERLVPDAAGGAMEGGRRRD